MTISNYLRGQLKDFVDNYQKYFWKTFGTTLTLTILCFVGSALLFRFTDFGKTTNSSQFSGLSYFFYRFSKGDIYSLVDLTKTIFVFFISLFSIGFIRQNENPTDETEFSFNQLIKKIKFKDFAYLVGILCFTCILDYAFSRLDNIVSGNSLKSGAYFHSWIFQLRIYLPLILFALGIRSLTITNKTKLTLKRILLLYLSLWIFNEFAFEIYSWVRIHLLGLILLPVDSPEKYYLYESFLGIPLIAFYFLGYHSALTTSLKQTEHQSTEESTAANKT